LCEKKAAESHPRGMSNDRALKPRSTAHFPHDSCFKIERVLIGFHTIEAQLSSAHG